MLGIMNFANMDYPLKIKFNENYRCIICNDCLQPPVKQLECGHRSCDGCIKHALSTKMRTCPGEEEDCHSTLFTEKNVFPDYGTDRELREAKIECSICQEQIPWLQITDHFDSYSCENTQGKELMELKATIKRLEDESKLYKNENSQLKKLLAKRDAENKDLKNELNIYKGKLEWKVEKMPDILDQVLQANEVKSIYSKPFFLPAPFQYKMCFALQISPKSILGNPAIDGDICIYLALMHNGYDDKTPFAQKYKLCISSENKEFGKIEAAPKHTWKRGINSTQQYQLITEQNSFLFFENVKSGQFRTYFKECVIITATVDLAVSPEGTLDCNSAEMKNVEPNTPDNNNLLSGPTFPNVE